MSFLKQPRREHRKPLSRRRECEKKRDEREREEISAFFLQKTVPDEYNAQRGKQRPARSFSSVGETKDDHFPTQFEHYGPRNGPGLADTSRNNHFTQADGETEHDEGRIRASTYISWSVSHKSSGPECDATNESAERYHHREERSSTPVHIREAMAQSGIFNGTGIAYPQVLGLQGKKSGKCSKDSLMDAESTVMGQPTAQTDQAALVQPVRIVRYQDRGTMADEVTTFINDRDDRAKSILKSDLLSDGEDERRGLADQNSTQNAARTQAPVGAAPTLHSKGTDMTSDHPLDTADQGIVTDEEGDRHDTGPERPKAPKWAVIERLEAAAKRMRPRSLVPGASPVFQVVQKHTPPVSNREIHPHTQLATRQAPLHSVGTNPIYDTKWLAPGATDTPSVDCNMTSATSTTWHPSSDREDSVFRYVPLHGILGGPVDSNHNLQSMSGLPMQYHNASTANLATRQTCIDPQTTHQSMQHYISQIEQEILDRPRGSSEHDGGGTCSAVRTYHAQEQSVTYLDDDNEPYSIHTEPYIGTDSMSLNRAPSTISQQSWTHAQSLDEEEERKFMASFWRTNRYTV